MASIRRWYIYLVCAISLQATAWAMINLLRDLLLGQYSATAMALPIAVIVIGLPVYLAHWLWAQSLARHDPEEKASHLRSLYLYGMLSGFLGPFIINTYNLVNMLFLMLLGVGGSTYAYGAYSEHDTLLRSLAVLVVLAILWGYHQNQANVDARVKPETGNRATIHRLYVLSFSAVGLTLTVLGIINFVRFLLYQIGPSYNAVNTYPSLLAGSLTDLIIGLGCWAPFWRQAQILAGGPSQEEKESALRKFYLYAAVFIGILGTVANVTVILASCFRRFLDLPPQGDVRQPLPNVIGLAILWISQGIILQSDTRQVEEAPRQAGIRRLYLYIMAAVGLAAFLGGMGGLVSIVIRTQAGTDFDANLRSQFAWFLSALLAGLPVWITPWRTAQRLAGDSSPASSDARRSIVRRIYLYFYLFAATMIGLSGAVYIVYRLVSAQLGETKPTLSDLGQAMAFTLIAMAVWAYHGVVLRRDGELIRQEQAMHLKDLRVVLINTAENPFGEGLTKALQHELPGSSIDNLIAQEPEDNEAEQLIKDCLGQASLIITPWTMAAPDLGVGPLFAAVLAASPARKLLLPVSQPGWSWAGLDYSNLEDLTQQAAYASRLIAAGQEVRPRRPMGSGTVFAIVAGVIILVLLAIMVAANFFALRN
jgi:hypothetical protein